MSKPPPSATALRVAELAQNRPTPFVLQPDNAQMAAIAGDLDLSALRKTRLEGEVRGQAAQDWLLTATLGATVTQPCAVTLSPVTTRIDVPVRRLFVRDYRDAADENADENGRVGAEIEMPEDDEVEPLGAWIDLDAVLIEALSLALPLYPRADGATLGETVLTEPGVAPLTKQAMKPFAGLAALKDQMKDDD
jgi:uncharacterized metal-binding protein YceD (DUF177 family)